MEIIKYLIVLIGLCFGLQLSQAQSFSFAAVDDTMWTMPGYPVSIDALQNDYNPDGDSIYILGAPDSIVTFHSYYYSCYAEMDTIIMPYLLTNDSLINYHIWDTGYVYVILDNPFYDFLDVNNINAQFNNFGHHFWELPGGDGSKFFAPNGSNQTSMYMNTCSNRSWTNLMNYILQVNYGGKMVLIIGEAQYQVFTIRHTS